MTKKSDFKIIDDILSGGIYKNKILFTIELNKIESPVMKSNLMTELLTSKMYIDHKDTIIGVCAEEDIHLEKDYNKYMDWVKEYFDYVNYRLDILNLQLDVLEYTEHGENIFNCVDFQTKITNLSDEGYTEFKEICLQREKFEVIPKLDDIRNSTQIQNT